VAFGRRVPFCAANPGRVLIQLDGAGPHSP
jgi:hypothetical protein